MALVREPAKAVHLKTLVRKYAKQITNRAQCLAMQALLASEQNYVGHTHKLASDQGLMLTALAAQITEQSSKEVPYSNK
ncbi:hypothetical protein [Neptunomonas marina]|uniref:Uncharacterized protein n=1 Tax=Neptunomonas marina TaxID=1815562 RepID=A0A437Q8Z1_9GAMM|nr:hypothetical protein [Neptunomonas marina]RVU30889.1 hypothetical protein EOE65_07685 [Neptunomonas marina]